MSKIGENDHYAKAIQPLQNAQSGPKITVAKNMPKVKWLPLGYFHLES